MTGIEPMDRFSIDKFTLVRREHGVIYAMGLFLLENNIPNDDVKEYLEGMVDAIDYHLLHKPDYWLMCACQSFVNHFVAAGGNYISE